MEKSVQEFQKNVLQLGLDIIREQFENIDERIKPSEKRKKKWSVVKSDPKTRLCWFESIVLLVQLFFQLVYPGQYLLSQVSL